MLIEIYLWSFLAICLGLLGWGFLKPSRIYQYPFFMGGIFIAFIAPQAISLVENQDTLPPAALQSVLLMSCLCAAMAWIGYQLKPSQRFIRKFDFDLDETRVLHAGIVFVLIGYLCEFLISRMPVEVTSTGAWTGIITIYVFFGSLVYPGFTMILMHTARYPRLSNFLLALFAGLLPLRIIILGGRRQPAATLLVTVGLVLFFQRRVFPPRWLAAATIFFTLVAIPMTGAYRNIAKSGEWGQLAELQPIENMQTYIEQGDILELRNAAYIVDTATKTGDYKYGTGFWDVFVYSFVPAQFVGADVKATLLSGRGSYAYAETVQTGYYFANGTTLTGIGDAFLEFDYFGSVFFLLSGYFFKHIWFSALYRSSVISQILYISLFAPTLLTVTHGVDGFPSTLFFYFVFLGIVVLYSRKKPAASVSMPFRLSGHEQTRANHSPVIAASLSEIKNGFARKI